jgi:endonuclease III
MPKPKPVKTLPEPEIEQIYGALERNHAERRTELDFVDPFTLLVSVVLSAQATDVSVNKATPALFAIGGTAQTMAALTIEEIESKIRKIGLYRAKAKNVSALAKTLVEQHGGEVPHSREALEALPGVGRKTANVVLNVAFGEPTIAVDTHIFRVGNRTGLAPGKTPTAVELVLLDVTPERFKPYAHHWLLMHGRYICKARVPECWHCPIVEWCRFEAKVLTPKKVGSG